MITDININIDIVFLANTVLLQLLLAYDRSQNTDQLKAAEELNEWIIQQKDKTMQSISILNRLQIIKRYREFTMEEMDCLYDLIENATFDRLIKVAAYLLLDNQEMAQKHFKSMRKNEQKKFVSCPIFYFAKFNKVKD